jgi:hypothetical protein
MVVIVVEPDHYNKEAKGIVLGWVLTTPNFQVFTFKFHEYAGGT